MDYWPLISEEVLRSIRWREHVRKVGRKPCCGVVASYKGHLANCLERKDAKTRR